MAGYLVYYIKDPEVIVHRKPSQTESLPTEDSSLTTRAQLSFRQGSGRRMAGAILVTIAALIALILMGPSQEDIKKRFEYYGAPGDLTIMPEIAIEDGSDQTRQLPKTLITPPPPSKIEVEPEEISENAENPRPKDAPFQSTSTESQDTTEPTPETEMVETNQVELRLPQQSNPDWFILHQVLPEYPFTALQSDQTIPVIQVRVAIFVDQEGNVAEAMIQSVDISSAFSNEVLEKIKQWKFGWRVDPKAGRWIELTFNFKSPYNTNPLR